MDPCRLWGRGSAPLFLVLTFLLLWRVQSQASTCTVSCGSNSACLNGTCSCLTNFVSPSGSNEDCISLTVSDPRCSQYDASCVYCGSLFQGPCSRCVDGLFLSGDSCVSFCAEGFQIMILPNVQSISARVCIDSGTVSEALPQWAIIVIAIVAVVIFVVIVVAILGFALTILTRSSHGQFDVVEDSKDVDLRDSPGGTLRTRRSNSFSFERKQGKQAVTHHNPNFIDEIEGDDETVFRHKLNYLRTQAEVFLKMLNDMRRRLKEIPVDSAAAQQYRNVMQDVTRLLYMLNKKPSALQMPPDGLQLLVWSEQILERYLTSQGVTLQKSTNRLSILGPQDETKF